MKETLLDGANQSTSRGQRLLGVDTEVMESAQQCIKNKWMHTSLQFYMMPKMTTKMQFTCANFDPVDLPKRNEFFALILPR